MQFKKEIPLSNNIVLGAIWEGFNTSLQLIKNELEMFDMQTWIDSVVYESKILELSAYHKELIKGNVKNILLAYKNIGTYRAYEELIRSLVGADADVIFENPAPAVLNVRIISDFGNLELWQKTQDTIETYAKEDILIKGVSAVLNKNEIIKLLEKLVPAGILVNFLLN